MEAKRKREFLGTPGGGQGPRWPAGGGMSTSTPISHVEGTHSGRKEQKLSVAILIHDYNIN